MQYTIRNISPEVDKLLRMKAKKEKKSLNQIAREALEDSVGVSHDANKPDISWIAGSMEPDPEFDEIIESFNQIDEELWK